MNNVTATATATATATDGANNYGVGNYDSIPKMNNVTATATGGTVNYGVRNRGGSILTIRNSSITGTTNSIYNDDEFSRAKIANTTLNGDVDGPRFRCAAVNEGFYELDDECVEN